jgi:ATP adenylyltransferase
MNNIKYNCPFCIKEIKNDSIENTILFEDEDFLIVPTIGSFIEGWLLIITKKHYLCAGQIPKDIRYKLSNLIIKCSHIVNKHYGNCLIFEHGPATENEEIGCSIDHCHIHILPSNVNILKNSKEIFNTKWKNSTFVEDTEKYYKNNNSYIYINNINIKNGEKICLGDKTPKQFIRKTLALALGDAGIYDYLIFPEINNIQSTILKLKNDFKLLKNT